MPVAYTDLFNIALDNLNTSITAITGLQCVNDPRNLVPPCAFIDAPSFTAFNYNIVNMMSKLLGANLAITDGRPTVAIIAGAEYPAYDVSVNMQAQTA